MTSMKKAMKKKDDREKTNDKKPIKFTYAKKTIKYFEKALTNFKVEEKYGRYLQLGSARFIENKKDLIVPIALYGGTGQLSRTIPASSINDTLAKLYKFWEKYAKPHQDVPENQTKPDPDFPLFVVGYALDEVFERKIGLLGPCIRDIRMLQYINVYRFFCSNSSMEKRTETMNKKYGDLLKRNGIIKNEKDDLMSAIHTYLTEGRNLDGRKYDILDWEVQAGEGHQRAEKIDFLAVEKSKRKWLTVIELKFTDLDDPRLQGSIFQGMDYCNWVERHKYELAMIYSDQKIHTRHRTKLILINGPDGFPDYYPDILEKYCSKDKCQEIELYSLKTLSLPIELIRDPGKSSRNP